MTLIKYLFLPMFFIALISCNNSVETAAADDVVDSLQLLDSLNIDYYVEQSKTLAYFSPASIGGIGLIGGISIPGLPLEKCDSIIDFSGHSTVLGAQYITYDDSSRPISVLMVDSMGEVLIRETLEYENPALPFRPSATLRYNGNDQLTGFSTITYVTVGVTDFPCYASYNPDSTLIHKDTCYVTDFDNKRFILKSTDYGADTTVTTISYEQDADGQVREKTQRLNGNVVNIELFYYEDTLLTSIVYADFSGESYTIKYFYDQDRHVSQEMKYEGTNCEKLLIRKNIRFLTDADSTEYDLSLDVKLVETVTYTYVYPETDSTD